MRKLLSVLLILLVTPLCFAEGHQQFLIYSQKIMVGSMGRSLPNTGFFVDTALLDGLPDWNPGERFPLSLGTAARQAASILKKEKRLDSDVDLNMVGIWRCPMPDVRITNAPSFEQSHRKDLHFVVLNYAARNMGPLVTSVVFLNGKYASEKDLTALATGSPDSGEQAFNIEKRAGIIPPQPAMPFLKRLHSTDLAIPSIQWDSTSQEFPGDVGRFIRLGAAALREKYTLTDVESLKFYDMTMYRFVPDEAVSSQGLTVHGNSHHWLLAIRFRAQGTNEALAAYLLLDGSIVETSRNEWPRFQPSVREK